MQRKKIAILIDLILNEKSGGHVKFWERIVKSLEKKKLNFDLYFYFLGKKKKNIKISKNIFYQIRKPSFSSNKLKFLGIDADATDLFPLNINLLFELKKYDLIHTTDQLHSMAKTAKLASKFWKIPLSTSFHTDTPSYTEYYILQILKKLPSLFQSILRDKFKVHKKVYFSQKKKIVRYFDSCKFAFFNDNFSYNQLKFVRNCKIKVDKITRGIDKDIFFIKKINRISFLKRYRINPSEKILFFCGRIHRLKGVILLSKINKILNEKGFNVTTIMAGENIHGKDCRDIYSKKLIILDYLDQKQISKFYNICDFFVFPSLYETGPQVVLEARACGAICFVTRTGGGKRIKKSGEDGIVLKEKNPEIWANEIIKLMRDKNKIKLMKKKIKATNDYLSWDEVFKSVFFEKWKSVL